VGARNGSVRPARHLYAVLSGQTPTARPAASRVRPLSAAATRRLRDQWASVGHYNLFVHNNYKLTSASTYDSLPCKSAAGAQ
jgi:hypothetical protein